MVDRLVEQGALEAGRVQEAFRSILRHWFLPGIDPSQVYAGHAIPTRFSEQRPISSSSEPAIMARMLAQLGVVRDHAVLEIGAGTGYNAALLSYLVGPKGSVVTIDLDEDITAQAKANLAMVLTRLHAHPIVDVSPRKGVPVGSPIAVSRGVPS